VASLEPRVRSALVTGASKGIGLAIARELASAGAWVGMVARHQTELAAAAKQVGGEPIPGDISSAEGVEQVAARVREKVGAAPDILVNSAGAFGLAPFLETDIADFDRQIAINLRGPFLLIRAFLKPMLARRSGHIINIGSVAGRIALPGNAAYGSSKFGLRGLHEVLAAELLGTGVRTTLIEPAATDTPLWDPLDPDSRTDLPSRSQMLRAEDVARAVRFVVDQPASVEISHLAIRAVL
jgi:NAD(P)-dependent dehydrogenase (short-subunit alcohol dehydrogenase family)